MTAAFAASPTDEMSEREIRNAELSRDVAAQGMVLLENNENALPIPQQSKIALYGGGAYARPYPTILNRLTIPNILSIMKINRDYTTRFKSILITDKKIGTIQNRVFHQGLNQLANEDG